MTVNLQTHGYDTQLFSDIFNASPIGIAVEDLNGHLLFVNPALCNFLGFSEEECRRKECVSFSPPEDAKKDFALLQRLKAGEIRHYQLEKRYFRQDGSLVWGRLSMSLLTSDPSPLVLAMVEDITEQRTAEASLRASEERLRLAHQAARIGSFERNLQTQVLNTTPELQAMYGLKPGSVTFDALQDHVHPEDKELCRKLAEEALRTGEPTAGEWRVIWPDQSVHWIAGRWQVLMNDSGEPSRVVGVNMDITERKVAEDKLHEYERVVEGADESIAVVDRRYRYLVANRQFLERLKLTREQVIGHYVYEFTDMDIFRDIILPQLDTCFRGEAVEYEMKYVFPELGPRDLLLSFLPIEDNSGISRAACIVRDITERKQISRKLIEMQEQERTRIARELHDNIGQRLGLLAVDLDLARQTPPETAAHMRSLLSRVWDEVSEVISDLHSISHHLHSSQLELLGLAAAMRGFCRELSARQHLEITFTSGSIAGSVPQDVSLCLFRVMQEAVHNAVKHSSTRQVEVRLRSSKGQLHLLVSDRGSGFDPESTLSKGGLGLTSMRERVRMVNGEIRILPRKLGGTTVDVRVPLTASEEAA